MKRKIFPKADSCTNQGARVNFDVENPTEPLATDILHDNLLY